MPPKKSTSLDKLTWAESWGARAANLVEKLPEHVDTIPSGSLSLDLGLYHGGIPKGCLVRLWGRKGCGKSTLAQRMAAIALHDGMPVIWFDFERAQSRMMMQANGIDIRDPNLSVFRYSPLEEEPIFYEVMSQIIDTKLHEIAKNPDNKGCLIICDSLEAAPTRAMADGEIEDVHMAARARLNSAWLPRLVPLLDDTHSIFVVIQQVRTDFTPMVMDKEKPGGGKALDHWAGVEIRLKSVGKLKAPAEGNTISFTIIKNRTARNQIVGSFWFRVDDWSGIDTKREILDLGVASKVILQLGAFYRFPSILDNGAPTSKQGAEKVMAWFDEFPEIMDTLEAEIRLKAKGVTVVTKDDSE